MVKKFVEKEEDDLAQIIRPVDVKTEMLKQLRQGKVKGTTTYNKQLDECWKWRQKEANLWTGYANEGKSLMLKQLCIIKALNENKKFAFASPEDFPPEEFFDDMIHTIAGITTDKDYPNHITEEIYEACFELIENNFFFVHIKPPNNSIKAVLNEFYQLCEKENIYGAIVDPLLKFARPKGFTDRDDIYASYIGSLCTEFCRDTNTSFHLVMHQLTPQSDSITKMYPEPSMYRIKGGGSWADGFDNVLGVWRPRYATDKFDTEVQFSSQKIKKQKLVGVPQKMQMSFERKSNRYCQFQSSKSLFNFDQFVQMKTQGYIS